MRCGVHYLVWSLGLLAAQPVAATLYYDMEVVAQTGSTFTNIEFNAISINDDGRIAFIGDSSAAAGFEGVWVQDPGGVPALISFNPTSSTRTFGPGLEINELGQVIARDMFSGESLLRLWNSNSLSSFTLLARSTTSPYDGLGFWAAVNNSNQHSSGAFTANSFLVTPHLSAPLNEIQVGSNFSTRPAIADDGTIVGRIGTTASGSDPIVIISPGGSTTGIGSPTWSELGRSPSISHDGNIVVWTGNRGKGRGVFALIRSTGAIVRVAGENLGSTPCSINLKRTAANPNACDTNPDLGYDVLGNEIYLTFTTAQMDERLGVELQEPAGTGAVAGNGVVVLFRGTPNAAGPDNPAIAGTQPLLFSNQDGLFTTRVDFDASLSNPSAVVAHERSAIPVAQIGESLRIGATTINVTSLAILDSLANVDLDGLGNPRIASRGDHQIVFLAGSGGTSSLVRAVSIDSDEDGLLDHWESEGIDVDHDGAVDLDLPAMGANPAARDLFLEIDSLQDHLGTSYRPVGDAIDFLVALFAGAPTGAITLHVDAGPSQSRNMGSNPVLLEGGDGITDGAGHIDFIYFGIPGSIVSPGYLSRSFQELKNGYFGTTDKRAREFAFRYAIFGDRGGTPTDDFLGLGEVAFFSDAQSIAGNDLLITLSGVRSKPPLPVGFIQYQTLAHELGHTLGLRHGGIDHTTTFPPISSGHVASKYKPDYLSLMNYVHTDGLPGIVASSTSTSVRVATPTTYSGINGLAVFGGLEVINIKPSTPATSDRRPITSNTLNDVVVAPSWTNNPVAGNRSLVIRESFSDSLDPVFDDWSALEFGFAASLDSIGTTFSADRAEPDEDPRQPGPTISEIESWHGVAFDRQLPVITVVTPSAGSTVSSGSPILVSVSVTDDIGVAGVDVKFDVDGDGTVASGEENAATLQPNGRWEVQIGPLSGANGGRVLTAQATDVSGATAERAVPVTVPEPGLVLMLLSGIGWAILLTRGRNRASFKPAPTELSRLRLLGSWARTR